MKQKLIIIICLIALLGSVLAAADRIPTIAIFDFSDVKGKVSEQGKFFSITLFMAVSQYDKIKMVERKELDKLVKERDLRLSGLAGRVPQHIIGQVNADYIVAGRIYEEEGEKIINLRLIRCSDGRIFGKSFFADLDSSDYPDKIAGKVAGFIYSKIIDQKSGLSK